MIKFIVSDYRKDKKETWYVVARPGYYRCADGTQKRDGTSFQSGPEWSTKREHALEFKSHRAAARVKNKCISAVINAI